MGGEAERSGKRDAYETALAVLATRDHSRDELRRKLLRKGCEPADVAVALDRLTASGLVDDTRFAAEFARSKLTSERAPSIRRVRQELQRRGVDAPVVSSAIEAVVTEEQIEEGSGLEAAARKKLLSMGSLETHVRRRRLFSYLARKGYDIDDINRLLGRVFE
jgi:regulatory protein